MGRVLSDGLRGAFSDWVSTLNVIVTCGGPVHPAPVPLSTLTGLLHRASHFSQNQVHLRHGPLGVAEEIPKPPLSGRQGRGGRAALNGDDDGRPFRDSGHQETESFPPVESCPELK